MNETKGKFGCTVTVGEKGQIVIPKQVREMFGICPGDTLVLLADENRGIAIPPKGEFLKIHDKVFGGDDK